MSIKFVLYAYEDYGCEDEADDLDWDDKTKLMEKELSCHISKYPEGKIEYLLKETDHGIGADLPTITIEILNIAGLVLFAIPALHKTIRETLKEWKTIKQNIDKVVNWIQKKKPIFVYPKKYAFLKVLEHLEPKVNILDLELIHAIEIIGKADTIYQPSIDNAELIYYLFIFREGSERCFIVLVDSHLNFVFSHVLGLDQRFRHEVEQLNNQKKSKE